MDTIHHLLRLNIEIEGVLRVLADRDNEIAMRILDEKTKQLAEIVSYLAHPEETSSTNTRSIAEITANTTRNISAISKPKDKKTDGYGSSVPPETIMISDEDLTSESSSDKINEELIRDTSSQTTISEPSENKIPLPESPRQSDSPDIDPTADSCDRRDADIAPDKDKTPLPEENLSIPDKRPKTNPQNDASKEKIRIDEMLSRREARNLSKAFTINDRFRFQLHIFDGDKSTFNSTIDAISALEDLDSAMTYLSGIIDTQSEDQDMVDFITIIKNHFEVD